MFWTILLSLRFSQDSVWPLSCLSEGAQATEESPQETLRLRLRVTGKKG